MTENMMMTSSRASIDDRFLIGGHWVPPADPASRYSVVSPVTGGVIADAADPSPDDADAAVAAARRAFDTGPWPGMSVAERAKYLGDFCDRFEQSLPEFNAAWTAESGAPIRHAARLGGNVVLLWRDLLTRASQLVLCERRALPGGDVDVLREPAGVAVIISAWNAPALYLAMKLVPALLAGCTVIWKMAQESPLTARVLARVAFETGLPDGVLSVLPASPQVSAALVDHPEVDKVSLTGGVPAGRAVMAACARRIANVTLELGGKSPAILDEDIPLDRVLPTLVPGFITFQGQVCIALSRLVVPAKRRDDVVDAVVSRLAELRMGDPADTATDLGPLGTRRQLERVAGYVQSGQDEGARTVTGGRQPAHLPDGFYFEPTVFTDVRPDMRIAQEEIFGPVLSVLGYRTYDEAIEIANGTPYGLAASVYTDDVDLAERTARRLRAGTVAHNAAGPSLFAPFGGYRQSGIGREGGLEGIGEFLQYKSFRRAPRG
jgi:aldehyde dehydrogenase (NAD+)